MSRKILVIEDDPEIVRLLKHYLEESNYQVIVSDQGHKGIDQAKREVPVLIILDLMLPGMDGLEVCKNLKKDQKTASIPVLMLTAKAEEADKIIGLELGADDYVTKPFSPRELMTRIKVLLRRRQTDETRQKSFSYGKLNLDSSRHEVLLGGKTVELTSKEFGLLETLLSNVGRVLSRDWLLNQIWGEDYYGGARTVDVHIRKLREKIPSLSQDILTVRNLGYKLKVK